MTKTAAIAQAKRLARANDQEYVVIQDDTDRSRYFVLSARSYWADPTIDEHDCVFGTVEGHYA